MMPTTNIELTISELRNQKYWIFSKTTDTGTLTRGSPYHVLTCDWSVSLVLSSDWSVSLILSSDWSVSLILSSDWLVWPSPPVTWCPLSGGRELGLLMSLLILDVKADLVIEREAWLLQGQTWPGEGREGREKKGKCYMRERSASWERERLRLWVSDSF